MTAHYDSQFFVSFLYCFYKVVHISKPPIIHSVTSSNTGSRINYLVSPQGTPASTTVYGKVFEGAACRPREQSVLCVQCLAHHPVHTQETCIILYVTEDQELAHGHKSQ